jgi:hypothetical protein
MRVHRFMITRMTLGGTYPSSSRFAKLFWGLRACVVALALFHFSENTADPDLWGHVFFGQRMLALAGVEKSEPFSWTVAGRPWINHEVLAELALGFTHRLAGGRGLLALKFAIGLLTFSLALRLGCRHLGSGGRALAWILAGLSVVEIAFGFAARPQIFTALGLVILLWLITRVAEGSLRWTLALPPLFLVWFNTHGGALLGLLLLAAAAGAFTLEWVWCRARQEESATAGRQSFTLALAGLGSALTMFLTPWGFSAPQWLLQSVAWTRPTIQEWNPTPIGWDHAPLFLLTTIALATFLTVPRTRRRPLWPWIVLLLLGMAALRHVRHVPLFAIAAMALLPAPLLAALEWLHKRTPRLASLAGSTAFRTLSTVLLSVAAMSILTASPIIRGTHRLTMEIPRDQYPVTAVEFIKQARIEGNLVVWVDWGEMCIWELPACPVSIDGRLDTCYPMTLIAAHWRFYSGEMEIGPDLDLRQADLALMPVGLKGWQAIAQLPDWKPVYRDQLAELWVRDPGRFPELLKRPYPVQPSPQATLGRSSFPDMLP